MTAPDDDLPLIATSPAWLEVALSDLEALYCDHVHCERKAAQSALSLVRNYPHESAIVDVVARLAHEETSHVIQVSALLSKRGHRLRYDLGDDYAHALRKHIRKDEPERLIDSLLVFALIEARSAERLALLAEALPDPEVAALYRSLATAERRHRDTFLDLVRPRLSGEQYRHRARELAQIEGEIVRDLPLRARIH